MSQYFDNDHSLPQDRKDISFRFLGTMYNFATMAGVFSKSGLDFGSRVLLETVIHHGLSGKLLDLGTGFGPIGVLVKLYCPSALVTMSDVNERACILAKENAERYHTGNRVIVSDGFANISDTFDAILFNPPIRAGKQVIYRLFEESRNHLNPGGSLWVVIRKDQGAGSAMKELQRLFTVVERRNRDRGYEVFEARTSDFTG